MELPAGLGQGWAPVAGSNIFLSREEGGIRSGGGEGAGATVIGAGGFSEHSSFPWPCAPEVSEQTGPGSVQAEPCLGPRG